MAVVNSCLLWGGQRPFVDQLVLFTRELLHGDKCSDENERPSLFQ